MPSLGGVGLDSSTVVSFCGGLRIFIFIFNIFLDEILRDSFLDEGFFGGGLYGESSRSPTRAGGEGNSPFKNLA